MLAVALQVPVRGQGHTGIVVRNRAGVGFDQNTPECAPEIVDGARASVPPRAVLSNSATSFTPGTAPPTQLPLLLQFELTAPDHTIFAGASRLSSHSRDSGLAGRPGRVAHPAARLSSFPPRRLPFLHVFHQVLKVIFAPFSMESENLTPASDLWGITRWTGPSPAGHPSG